MDDTHRPQNTHRLYYTFSKDGHDYFLVQRNDSPIQGNTQLVTGIVRPSPSDLGRSPLFEGEQKEDEESGGFAPVEIRTRLIFERDTVLESPYRAVQSLRHGSAGEMESGELWQQVLRRIRLLEGTVKGSEQPIRVTVEVEVHHDTEAKT